MAQDPARAKEAAETSANIALLPSQKSQQALVEYVKLKSNEMYQQFTLRTRFEAIDRAHIREIDRTKENVRARIANRYGDADRIQNITVPVIMPQVKAAVTYQSSVFLTGMPIFGVASNPAYIDAAMMMESIIEQEQVEAGWVRNLMLFLNDGFKYNYSAVEVDWKAITTASLSSNVVAGKNAEVTTTTWEGNHITRLDPYNTFHDPSVASADVPLYAEYAGYTMLKTRVQLKEYIKNLKYKINVTDAFAAGATDSMFQDVTGSYYRPKVNPASYADEQLGTFKSAGDDWSRWMELADTVKTNKFDYKSHYIVKVIYARIIPSEFALNVTSVNTAQIFKLIVVNDSVLIHVEKQTNAHGMLPILFGTPLEDGLSFEDKSLAENAEPFQSVATALVNSMLAGRRRAVSDRIAYDPSRVPEHLMNKPGVARIPLRPSAYGGSVGDAFYQFPFRDEQAGIAMQEVQQILALGNEVNGQNKARQGQFVKGNKTQREFDTVMANANGRDQMTAILLEDQVFSKLKKIIKINILQYHGAAKIFSRSKNMEVQVDPTALRNAVMEFKISDGLTPTDKLMDADSFTVALQTLGSAPQLSGGYNVTPMFSYLMKQRGADLSPFEKTAEQIAYEQAVAAWQQAVAAFAKGLENGTVTQEQLPPQPTPEQFGYKPQGTQANTPTQQPRQTSNVNNITNNITNNRQ